MKTDLFNKFLTFLNQLEQQKINYQISHHRDEAVMITVATAGERCLKQETIKKFNALY